MVTSSPQVAFVDGCFDAAAVLLHLTHPAEAAALRCPRPPGAETAGDACFISDKRITRHRLGNLRVEGLAATAGWHPAQNVLLEVVDRDEPRLDRVCRWWYRIMASKIAGQWLRGSGASLSWVAYASLRGSGTPKGSRIERKAVRVGKKNDSQDQNLGAGRAHCIVDSEPVMKATAKLKRQLVSYLGLERQDFTPEVS